MVAIRVAVIGAGGAGIAAAKLLSEESDLFSVVVFEQTGHIGGTWVYVEQAGKDDFGLPIHSSMYRNLRTNLPKEIMQFPELTFDADLQSFPTHKDVLHYLERYADKFNVRQYIKLRHFVENVSPRHDSNGAFLNWSVRVRDLSAGTVTEGEYDVVLVCNGHYAEPKAPQLEGMETFTGEVVHSHDYRHPERFAGKRVVILGAASSGQDIALDMAKFATKVYLSHENPRLSCKDVPANITEKFRITRLAENKVYFRDGSEEEVDCLLFATGYKYSYPFLDESCQIRSHDHRVTPLFRHMVNIEYPSMFLIGIPFTVCPFVMFHQQILLVRSLLMDEASLPSKEGMLADEEKEYDWRLQRGFPHRHAHKMDFLQFKYMASLAAIGKFPPVPKVIEDIWMEVFICRNEQLIGYKLDHYHVVDEETYIKKEGDHPPMEKRDRGYLGMFIPTAIHDDRDSYLHWTTL